MGASRLSCCCRPRRWCGQLRQCVDVRAAICVRRGLKRGKQFVGHGHGVQSASTCHEPRLRRDCGPSPLGRAPNAAHINEPTQQSNPPSTATSIELDALVQRVLQDGLPSTASESALETGRDEPHRERHGSIHDLPSLSSRLIGRSGDHSAMLGRNVVGLDTVAPAGDSVAAPATLFEPGPEPELERVSLDAERSGRFVLLMSPTLWPASNLVHRERFQIPDSCGSRLTHGCRSAGGSPPRRANHRHSWGCIHRNETCSARMLPTVMIPTPMRPPTGGQSSA